MASSNPESPSRGGVMVTNLNDVEIAWDPISGEKYTMVQSMEKKLPEVSQNGDAKEISEAVIKKCSKMSDPISVPKDLNDSNIINMINDLEMSLEDHTGSKTTATPTHISKSPMHANNIFLTKKSLLPKPEISPKPAHLKTHTMGSISPSPMSPPPTVNLMTGSVHLPVGGPTFQAEEKSPVAAQPMKPGFPLAMSSSCNVIPPPRMTDVLDSSSLPRPVPEVSAKALNEKNKGTSSMLKNTLRRITKLSIKASSKEFANPDQGSQPDRPQSSHSPLRRSMSPFRSAKKSNSPPQEPPPIRNVNGTNSLRKKKSLENISSSRAYGAHAKGTSSSNPSSLNRNKSLRRSNEAFKVPSVDGVNVRSLSRSTSNSSSSSNVVNAPLSMPNRSHSLKRSGRNKDLPNGNSLQRSGSGVISGSGVKRSNSMHQNHHGNRRFRDRDLNVRLSRGTQTRLTRDAINDEEDTAVEDAGTDPISTSNVEFTLYMPDLLGVDMSNEFETHISEPLEPVDVRKNRQLTLDNMRLHREIEKLKSAANESDHLKRELRSVRSRLEEEQRSRARIEHELDQHNEKVKLIAKTMDSVEQEFERRDQTVKHLEAQIHQKRSQIKTLEDKLRVANDVITSQNRDIAEAVASQKSAVREYERAEIEANELHEFLQAEKFTLAEALKEAEAEAEALKSKLESSEERCGHLVRLGEQRHQEILALEAQLKAMEMKAKEMLLAQGAEISRSSVLIAELSNKIEEAFKSMCPEMYQTIAPEVSQDEGKEIEDELIQPEEEAESGESSLLLINGADQSLQNLSNAIKNRVSVENKLRPKSNSSSAPSLVDRISRTEKLLDQFISAQKHQQQSLAAVEPPIATDNTSNEPNGVTECPTDQKENIAINGNDPINEESKIAKKYEEEMAEMKAKYLKHRQILVANREAAESEVTRLDDIFHDTVNDVLHTLASLPEVVKTNAELSKLQTRLQAALLDEDLTNEDSNGRRANGSGKTMDIMNQINAMKPNGNLIAGPPTSSEQSL